MIEWIKAQLGSVCAEVMTGGTPLSSTSEYYSNGTIPWLKTKEVNFNRITSTEYYITEKGLQNSSAKMIPQNSVIVAMYGQGDTAGRVAINKIPLATNQACCNLVIDRKKAHFEFVYYLLSNSYEELVLRKTGSAQPNLNTKLLKEFEILLPPLNEQIAIAEVLSSLDGKIDLLHRQNKTLEQLAETLFRQWFVEEAEESWEEKSLDEIATFLNGLACQKFPPKPNELGLPVIKIKEMKGGISESSDRATAEVDDKYLVHDGDMLFSWSGSLDIVLWSGGVGVLNQHLFKVSSEVYPQWFYYFWTLFHLLDFRGVAEDKATTMGHIQRHHLSDAKVLVPTKTELEQMNDKINPLFLKIKSNQTQIRTLTQLRDTLLPKLMSGEVRLNMI